MKQEFNDYYLGLDIGTNSVGWAVTDTNYNVLRFNKKSMWGARLFTEAQTSETRRNQRAARRRLKRRKYRIQLLQELFESEITKIDEGFFIRLKESNLHIEDRNQKNHNTLFTGTEFNDNEYFAKYPTIFHLRKSFLSENNITDVRLLYLAIHNIIKKRGHFIFDKQNINSVKNINNLLEKLLNYLENTMDIKLNSEISSKEVENILLDLNTSRTDKIYKLLEHFNTKDKRIKQVFTAIVGNKSNFKDMFGDENYPNEKEYKIKFSEIDYDEKRENYVTILNDRIELIDILKSIYDWLILSKILGNNNYISESMIDIYDMHKKQLKELKYIIKKYSPKKYNLFFKDKTNENGYNAYINHEFINKKGILKGKNLSQENLAKEVKSILLAIKNNIEDKDATMFDNLLKDCEEQTILPKQRTSNNGVIPYQIHKHELEEILKQASKNFDFLNHKDESGLTVSEKILKLIEFRIPYYIGPLNNYHENNGFAWVVRKENGRVTPWNFEDKIDIDSSHEKFITNLTNKCTYLICEDVLPKDSLLYSEFKALNEINNIKINGKHISEKLKQEIFDELMRQEKNITISKLKNFIKIKGLNVDYDTITGIDNGIKSSLKSHIYFDKTFGQKISSGKNKEIAEHVILYKCLYLDDQKAFKRKIKEEFGDDLNPELIKKFANSKFNGWGRLSKKFLLEIEGIDTLTGECFKNIREALYVTNYNLSELLSERFTFKNNIEEFNKEKTTDVTTYTDMVDELYLAPNLKRGVNQTVKILEEIKKITGKNPKKIFIEMARGSDDSQKGKRTNSRKDDLLKYIEKNEKVYSELENFDNSALKSKKLFLYFKQLGRCMYSNNEIDLENLFDNNVYDIDHIYPQSKVKDDSIDNLVLVDKKLNARKSDKIPIDENIQDNMNSLWKTLHKKGLMSTTKFNRLTRAEKFTESELAGFISRQLVETRQTIKAISRIIPMIFQDTDIIYLKAKISSEFRRYLDFVKVREMNNFHHAHDAYFAIVAGNAYDVKFTRNPLNFIKNYKSDPEKYKYSLRRMYDYDIKRNNIVAWDVATTKKMVLNQLQKNNVLITEMSYIKSGELFDATIYKKTTDTDNKLPINSKELNDISKYGYYNSIKGAYFFVVEHTLKNKRVKTIEILPIYMKSKIKTHNDLLDYCINTLNLKEPDIILDKLPYYSKIKVNGYPCIITGKTNSSIYIKNTIPLILNLEHSKILKDVIDYIKQDEKYRTIKKKRINPSNNKSRYETNEEARIRFDKELISLYNVYQQKLTTGIYENRSSIITKQVTDNQELFETLTCYQKSFVLSELTKIFSNNATTSADLRFIKGKTAQGVFIINKNITNSKVIVIYESVTGLFTNTLEL